MRRFLGRAILCALCLAALTACASVQSPPRWAEDVTLKPGWARLGGAAREALLSRKTWLPVVAAGLLQVGNMDRRLSTWAYKNNPLFGSPDGAERFQTSLRSLSGALYIGTLVVAPNDAAPLEWGASKLTGLALMSISQSVSHNSVNAVKDLTNRSRPNGVGGLSFPSVYASELALTTTMIHGNLRSMPMPRTVRAATDVGLLLMTGLGSWARVEAGEHYPSDVLVGMALGHFLGTFVDHAFLHTEKPGPLTITGGPAGSIGLGVQYQF